MGDGEELKVAIELAVSMKWTWVNGLSHLCQMANSRRGTSSQKVKKEARISNRPEKGLRFLDCAALLRFGFPPARE